MLQTRITFSYKLQIARGTRGADKSSLYRQAVEILDKMASRVQHYDSIVVDYRLCSFPFEAVIRNKRRTFNLTYKPSPS